MNHSLPGLHPIDSKRDKVWHRCSQVVNVSFAVSQVSATTRECQSQKTVGAGRHQPYPQTTRWRSIQRSSALSTNAGYDLLSRTDKGSLERLFIEVKSSERPWADAGFFLSRNEWEFLRSKGNSVLHLWSHAGDQPSLAVLPLAQITHQTPMDRGSGEWQSVKVPFRVSETEP
jgi:hypothetical protein